MNLTFITSCLEPGHDGIGDYTLMLANECAHQGHTVSLVAFRDRFLKEIIRTDSGLVTLRLPRESSPDEVMQHVSKFLGDLKSDGVSLQFAPYVLHPRGLVHEWVHRWPMAFSGRKTHVMVHETWIGASRLEPLKDKILGLVQRRWIVRMLKALKPAALHTSNPAYAALLRNQGLQAAVLPLFSSVPVQDSNADHWLFAKLLEAGLAINESNRSKFWLFGIFGTIHPVWPPEPLLGKLLEAGRKHSKTIVLLSLGNVGSGEELWSRIVEGNSAKMHCQALGMLDALHLSQAFNSLDYGIATTPWEIIGKSSAAAAMLDHGLPVIVNRNDFVIRTNYPNPVNRHPQLHLLGGDFVEQLPEMRRAPAKSRLAEVSKAFLDSLQ